MNQALSDEQGQPRRSALGEVRVVDLASGIAGPMAAMFLADFGAEVVKVEPPGGHPDRDRPGFAMWNRNKRGFVAEPHTPAGRQRLAALLAGADVCVHGGSDDHLAPLCRPEAACAANPSLVYLSVTPYLGATPWAGGEESPGLLAGAGGIALRQSSFDGGPVDAVFPHVAYVQAIWAAAAGMAALVERQRSGHGQHVTVGGVHATMVSSTGSLVIDPSVPEVPASYGPGGPGPMYSRYRCSDGRWIFLATLIPKFQRAALSALGLEDIAADERIGGELERMLTPANRSWVRARFEETFASRSSDEWLAVLRRADVPAGPLLERQDWLDSPEVDAIGMRLELDDPHLGKVAMPANPINLAGTPVRFERPAPAPGADEVDLQTWTARPAPNRPAPGGPGPLAGIRILDLGAILAGPYAGTLLAELGADVIKVEVPAGDSWRVRGMPYIRGQRGVAVDLSCDAGRQAFAAMVRSAEVVIDNYRAGVLARLQIDYEHLRAVKDDIITLSITAFGEDSPFAGEPAFDPLLQARSGMMTAQGGDSEPVLFTVPINDVTTAALAALTAVVSIFHRRRRGEGQRASLTLAGTATLAQCEELIQAERRPPALRGGRDFPGPSALDRYYQTRDGWVRIQADPGAGPAQLQACGLVNGPLPEGEAARVQALSDAFAAAGRDESVAALRAAGVPAVAARRVGELVEDPEYRQWQVFDRLERAGMDPLTVPGRYARFSRTQRGDLLIPPGVGEHTREVLAGCGVEEDLIAEMLAGGALRQGQPIVYRSFSAYR